MPRLREPLVIGGPLVQELSYSGAMPRNLSVPALLSLGLASGCFSSSNLTPNGSGTGGSAWTNVGQGGSTVHDAATETACDPLAPKPITLGAIVGVGRDATGTLYVDSASGIFVSVSGEPIR